jgi:pSer/pThr/pTyr-binding forkhead associated (FHA) protein
VPKLLVEKGPNKGQSLVLRSTNKVVVGREPSCQFILNDSNVSRKHCELNLRGSTWSIRDLGSRNGTYVNGKKLSVEKALAVGDRVQTGEILFSFLDETEGQNEGGLIGQRIGGYRIIERLGRGGMGTVYKANQIALNREVALKVLSQDLIREEMFRNLFIAEARSAAALNHPNIVQVHDVGIENGIHFFSMEFVPNGSVHELLQREGRLTPARALRVAMDACAGLSYAERRRIVHRDIKPENLMIGESGMVKIGDLGLAFDVEKGDLDDEVGVMGTPHFCAPEQVLRQKLDHRTDLYALGATMYRMLAGRPPFVGQTLKEILVKKVKETPVPLSEVVPGLPPAVNDLVMQLLERDPGRRPQSAEEVRGRIEAILPELEGMGILPGGTTRRERSTTAFVPGATPSASGSGVSAAVVPPARTGALIGWLAMASCLLAGALGLFGWQYFKGRGGQEANGPVSNGDTSSNKGESPVSPSLADRADSAMQEVERWMTENRPPSPSLAFLNKAVLKYEEVAEKFKDTFAGKAAKEKADTIKGQIFELNAKDALVRVNALYDEAGKRFDISLSADELEPMIPLFEDIARRFPGTESAGAATDTIESIRHKMEQARKGAAEWDSVKLAAANARDGGDWAAALRTLDEFITAYKDSGWDERAALERTAVEKSARDRFLELLRVQLPPLVAAKDWSAAQKLLADAQGRFGLADLEAELRKESQRVADLASRVVDPPPPVAPDDAQIEAEALAKTAELEREWKFGEAEDLCRTASARVKAPDAAARLKQASDDCGYMEILRLALRAHANGNDRDNSGLKRREFRGTRIMGATETGLTLEKGAEVPWSRIEAGEAFRLTFNGWVPSGREAIGAGCMCVRARLWRSARYAFAAAGAMDEAMRAQANAYADRSDREERSLVPTAPLAVTFQQIADAERKEANLAADLIIRWMTREKDWRGQGEVYSGIQLFQQSDQHLRRALDDRSLSKTEEWRARLFLMLNAIMEGDEKTRSEQAFKCRDMLPQAEYSDHVKDADRMSAELVDSLVEIDGMFLKVMTSPDAPTTGRLLRTLTTQAHLLLDQRIVARWLTSVKEWKTDAYVRTGEPQRWLAVTCQQQRDYFNAKKMFEKLRRDFPTHEWCRSVENGSRRVDDEYISCGDKVKKYGLGR